MAVSIFKTFFLTLINIKLPMLRQSHRLLNFHFESKLAIWSCPISKIQNLMLKIGLSIPVSLFPKCFFATHAGINFKANLCFMSFLSEPRRSRLIAGFCTRNTVKHKYQTFRRGECPKSAYLMINVSLR